jgi:hypothetical protein
VIVLDSFDYLDIWLFDDLVFDVPENVYVIPENIYMVPENIYATPE